MKTINTKQLKSLMDDGNTALFDVRGDVDYEKSHIPGAKTSPLGSLVFRVAGLMNPESLVVVYSSGEGCTLAARAVERLEQLRMKNVHCYEEGLKGWLDANLSVVASVRAKTHTHGEFLEVRPVVVDRENAYGGAFKDKPTEEMGGAGG